MNYNQVVVYEVEVETKEPFYIGSNDVGEVLKHPVTGIPFLPATAIAGVLNHYVKENYQENCFAYTLIDNGGTGRKNKGVLKIRDGVFQKETVKFELRERIKINGHYGVVGSRTNRGSDAQSGQKFSQEFITQGAKLCFTIEYNGQEEDVDQAMKILEDCFEAIECGDIAFGGQISQGCGKITICKIKKYRYNLQKEKDRNAYLSGEKCRYEKVTLKGKTNRAQKRIFELKGTVKQALLVKLMKKEFVNGVKVTVAGNMRNGHGDFMIPGSSIKGVFRNQVEKILSVYFEEEEKIQLIIEKMFGSETQIGILKFQDIIIKMKEEKRGKQYQNRIRIDYFTGSVFHGGLLYEEPIKGEIELRVEQKRLDIEEADMITALLLFVFRDIAEQQVSFGSSASIGRGFIDVQTISLYGDTEIEIYPDIKDCENKIPVYLGKLKEEVTKNV